MPKILPINAIRTTEKWLLDNGFQKLKKVGGGFLFKNRELYIEHFDGSELANPTWYRTTPMADSTSYYSGIPNKTGYDCSYQHMVLDFYEYIHGTKLVLKA